MSFELPYGTYDSTIDEKGRVIIPAPLRERYKGELVITQGTQHCVWVMLPEIWTKFLEKLENSDEKVVDPELYELLQYNYVIPARVTEIDKATGRIPIAPKIRAYAGLSNKKCLVMSAENRLEIWDNEFHDNYLKENQELMREAKKKIGTRFFKFGAGEGILQ